MTFPRPNLHCASPMSLEEFEKLTGFVPDVMNKEKVMKYKEIKNKTIGELTTEELGVFIEHIEVLQRKYLVTPTFITIVLFSDLSGTLKRANDDDLSVDIVKTANLRDIKWAVRTQLREFGKR